MQPTDPLDDTLKRHLSYFYLSWALVLLVIGTVVLTQVTRQIGLTYGGFIWTYDPSRTPPFYVGPELWRFRPPSPQELRLGDVIQSIDGRSPWEFEQVYTSKQPGEIVTYDIERDKQPLVVKEPVRLFTWDAFLISHGLLYLTGVSYLLAGYVLLRGTRRKDLAVLAFVFPPAAGAWLFHGVAASIHAPYEGPPWIGLLLWTPAMPLAAAVLLHFAMIFPSPNRLVTKYPAIPLMGYGIAVLLIVFYATTFRVETTELGYIAFVAMLVYLVISMIAVVAGSAIGYRNAVRQNDVGQQRIIATMAAVWFVGAAIFVVFGIVPFIILGYSVLPWEVSITMVLLLPLALVYAVRNAEMIARLQQEVALRQQYASTVQEMRNIRERTLDEIGNALHDVILSDLGGISRAAVAARMRLEIGKDLAGVAQDLTFMVDELDHVLGETRAIMEGAKPIDWQQMSLSQSLAWLVEAFCRANQGLVTTLDTASYDEADTPTVKEALYWIARAALGNVREHAHARSVQVSLSNITTMAILEVADDGAGFDPSRATRRDDAERRHFGLANMRLRAAEIGGGLYIESRPGQGTRIVVQAPRLEEAT